MHHPYRTTRLAGFLAGVLALTGAGCSASVRHARHPAGPRVGEVTGNNAADAARALDEAPPGQRASAGLRDAVARYLAIRGLEAAQAGDYEGAIGRLQGALSHYTAAELSHGDLPDPLSPLARAVLDAASARGDEAHALAASRVLMALHTADATAAPEFRRIAEWGERNRHDFQRPWVSAGELAEIYKEVARIIPATDVLEHAADLIVTRRRAATEARNTVQDGGRLNFDEMRQLQMGLRNAPADLAILYLREGEIHEAANRVTQLGAGGDSGLASALGAIAGGEGGAEGLAALADRLERIDPPAAAGVCRVGRVDYPADARFAQCLALAAARENDFGLASAHLEAAVALSPSDQRTLRVAIEAAGNWLAHEIGADDVTPGRHAYDRAAALLAQWRRQYPRDTPPLAEADLEETAAQLELAAGALPEAQAHLERATRAQPASRDAFATLAEIAWRHGDGATAARLLAAGVALPLRPSESDSLFRPIFTVRLAQAAEAAHDAARARQLYTEAAGALDALVRSTSGHDLAVTWLNRAVVAAALGDTARVRPALNAALDAAPDNRDVAARAITFALGRGLWSDARDLDRVSRAQLNLDRSWQVYFGLWGMAAARLGHLDDDGGAHTVIEGIASGATPMSAWTVRLAQRYTGALDREGLARFARTNGQRAEAAFYEGVLRLGAGDAAGAEADLRAVLQTETLRYFEYDMAWEMAQHRVRPAPGGTVAAAPASPGAPAVVTPTR